MAEISKHLIHFDHKASFNNCELAINIENSEWKDACTGEVISEDTDKPRIRFLSIVFIKDTLEIWTHGCIYSIPEEDKVLLQELNNNVQELFTWVEDLDGYVSNDLILYIDDLAVPLNGKDGLILMWDAEKRKAVWSNLTGMELLLAYGVEWDITVADPHLTRIGNMGLHKTLPIQSLLKGCIAQGSKIIYWLDEDNWEYKKGGNPNKGEPKTLARLDGYDGTVRVYCPRFYIKSEIIGNKRRVWLSTIKIDNTWTCLPEILIDAYRCTVLNEVPSHMGYLSTLKVNSAISVVNQAYYCRGGNNNPDYDKYFILGIDPARSLLQKPRTAINRATMRTYARNAGSELLSYDQYKNIFYWLFVVERATFNCLEESDTLTLEGYHQGGLGLGMTLLDYESNYWQYYNELCPLALCGQNNFVGNRSATTSIYTKAGTNNLDTGDIEIPSFAVICARWRGFENPFGDIWTNLDGIIIDADADNHPNNMNYVYTCQDPEKFGDVLTEDYKKIGEEIHEESDYTKLFDLGEAAHIIPNTMGGNINLYKCDIHWTGRKNTTLRTLYVGGLADDLFFAGIGAFNSSNSVSGSWPNVGYRTVSLIK